MDNFCKKAAAKFVSELQNDENREKLEHDVLDPVISYIGKRLYPYVISASILVISFTLLLIYLAYCVRLTTRHLKTSHQS